MFSPLYMFLLKVLDDYGKQVILPLKKKIRDKKKELAPNYAAYYPFGVDVYLSPQKLNHISRYVQLPDVQISSKLPPLLVVNVQVSYPNFRLLRCSLLVRFYRYIPLISGTPSIAHF